MEEETEGTLPFMSVRFSRSENGQLKRIVHPKPTHTNRYVQLQSHLPNYVKSVLVECWTRQAITFTVCSDEKGRKVEIDNIEKVMSENGYPKRFVEKSIPRQLKTGSVEPDVRREDSDRFVIARIPVIDGLSQQISRVARAAGICCSFTSTTLEELYNCKD